MNSTCRRSTTAISAPTSTRRCPTPRQRASGGADLLRTGPGAPGRRSLTPGWYGGFGAALRPGLEAAAKTVVRFSGGSSYAPVKSVNGSAHFQGFAQILTFPDQTSGIEHVFKFSDGRAGLAQAAVHRPHVRQQRQRGLVQGQEANRLPQMWSARLTLQREFRGGP